MKISELLKKESISLNVNAENKSDAIEKICQLINFSGNILDYDEFKKSVIEREKLGTTGIGSGVAIPHGKSKSVKSPTLAAMTLPQGVDFESLDGQTTKLVFLIAVGDNSNNEHLEILSKISSMLMKQSFINKLINAKTNDEFIKIIDDEEKSLVTDKKESSNKELILAVTACPTGIAHTYMAKEALEIKAKELGYNIKVETRGAGGVKDQLSKEDIDQAIGIIVAADTSVPLERFNGKKVVQTQVSKAISKPQELIVELLNSQIYKSEVTLEEMPKKTDNDFGHSIYKHLMNGVSHMLPFVVGGGILIALAFLIDGLMVDINSLSIDQRANFGTITGLASQLKTIGGVAFGFMLPILAGFISMSISDRPGLAVGFVGGAIAASGTSGFLGAIVAGFLAGYIIKFLQKITSSFPKSLDGIKPVLIYPLFGILLVGLMMNYLVEPLVGSINTGLNSWLGSLSGISSVLLGVILGAMMSIDMGGPFNKAAYVFGTASIAAQNYSIMAAVMVGGMVPPCAIALATIIFKNKFTEKERKSGPVNFIMGLSFITEGAIPYAASDPLRVIPACMIGSGIAGGLSMFFNCTLMAPHGGIFVFPVVGNPIMYIVSLVIGTLVGAISLGLLKNKIN